MAEITAGMVKELRELTGLGMMECKKALEEAGGDIRKAEELLRIKSGAKASKAAARIAAEGAIGAYLSPDAKVATMVGPVSPASIELLALYWFSQPTTTENK